VYLVDTDVISNARKRVGAPHAENPLDKQIAATALIYGLTVVTRNVSHYEPTGVAVLNPFT
jgi:predicted nucleic acid-binding protein